MNEAIWSDLWGAGAKVTLNRTDRTGKKRTVNTVGYGGDLDDDFALTGHVAAAGMDATEERKNDRKRSEKDIAKRRAVKALSELLNRPELLTEYDEQQAEAADERKAEKEKKKRKPRSGAADTVEPEQTGEALNGHTAEVS